MYDTRRFTLRAEGSDSEIQQVPSRASWPIRLWKVYYAGCLCCLNEISSGKISIDGVNIASVSPYEWRLLGVIPQVPSLFSGTMRFNVDPKGVHSSEGSVKHWMPLGCKIKT